MVLNPREHQLVDLIHAFAATTEVPLDEAPGTVWRVARYGGTAGTFSVLQYQMELAEIRALSEQLGVWVEWGRDDIAESVALVEWRRRMPEFTLGYTETTQRDSRFSAQPGTGIKINTVHVRAGAGLNVAPVTLCDRGMAALSTQDHYHVLELPNTARGDICVDCEQRMAASIMDAAQGP